MAKSLGTSQSEATIQLPFFPTSEYERQNHVHVWWFEGNFSQTWYGDAAEDCHACTLIVLLTASTIAKRNIRMEAKNSLLPSAVVRAFAEAIIQGNSIYRKLYDEKRLPGPTLNIPEAMSAAESLLTNIKEWNAFLYIQSMVLTLYDSIQERIDEWIRKRGSDQNYDYLFVGIISASRSILFVFQENPATVTLFDSHQHSREYGGAIAQVRREHLRELCEWTSGMFTQIYQCYPKCYELSLIEIKKLHSLVRNTMSRLRITTS